MAQSITTNEIQAVLAQDDWLRRAARRLFRDGTEAEDAAQETWAAELEQCELSGVRRAWRFGVLRNQKHALLRANSRRKDHASDVAAQGERLAPATDEVVADLQLREHAAQALLALGEPWRTAIYMRYVNDHPVGEIAERLGIAQSTASGRIARGLEKLRLDLDRRYGNDRAAWRAALAPLALPSLAKQTGTAATTAPTWSLSAGLAVAVSTAAAGAIAFALWGQRGSAIPGDGGAPATASLAPPATTGAPTNPIPPLPAPSKSSRSALSAPVSLGSAALDDAPRNGDGPPSDQPEPAEIKGTVLLPNGAPARGATWQVHAIAGNGKNIWKPGEHTGRVESDGSFTASFPSADSVALFISIELDGYVSAGKQWKKLMPGEAQALGKVRLERAGILTGQLLDPAGKPVLGKEWRLRLMAPGALEGLPISKGAPVQIDPKTGKYNLPGLSAGEVQINYFVRGKGWQGGPVATVVAGEIVTANIVHDGTFKDNLPKKRATGNLPTGFNPLPKNGWKPTTKKKTKKPKPSAPIELTIKLTLPKGTAERPNEVVESAFMGEEFGSEAYLKGKGRLLGPGTINANAAETLWVRGDDWIARYRGADLKLVDGATVTLDLRVSERRVRFLLDGKPLAKREVDLQILPMRFAMRPKGGTFRTDADGYATVRLGELPKGETYRFSIKSKDPAEFLKFIEAPWPHQGGQPNGGPLTLEFK